MTKPAAPHNEIITTDWQTHEPALRQLRSSVFVDELGVPAELEFDTEDAAARHFLALDAAEQPLGCARLLDTGQLGRVAVTQEHRQQRIGQALISAAIDAAMAAGMSRVYLNAQTTARGFYERLDFRACSDEFVEAGIAHICMEMPLPIAFTPSPSDPDRTIITKLTPHATPANRDKPPAEPRASKLREFFNEIDALSNALQVIHGAKRCVKLYSPELDHALFDTPDMVQMLSEFVRAAPSCHVEILITRTKPIVSRGHALLELARRLDGKIAIRRVPEGLHADAQSWLIADNHGVWVQSEPDEYRGWCDTFNPVQAERFDKRFIHFWDRSVTDSELRVLRL